MVIYADQVCCFYLYDDLYLQKLRGAHNYLSLQASLFLQIGFAISLLFGSPNSKAVRLLEYNWLLRVQFS